MRKNEERSRSSRLEADFSVTARWLIYVPFFLSHSIIPLLHHRLRSLFPVISYKLLEKGKVGRWNELDEIMEINKPAVCTFPSFSFVPFFQVVQFRRESLKEPNNTDLPRLETITRSKVGLKIHCLFAYWVWEVGKGEVCNAKWTSTCELKLQMKVK